MNKASGMMKIYFIKQKDTNLYIHPVGKHLFESVYGLRNGKVGACGFNNEQAELYLLNAEALDGIKTLIKEELKP